MASEGAGWVRITIRRSQAVSGNREESHVRSLSVWHYGLFMGLPPSVARFNKRWTNWAIEPLVRRTDGFAVVGHQGRRTGRWYESPVKVFEVGDRLAIVLTYGSGCDWCRNVLAGGAELRIDGEASPIIDARVLPIRELSASLPRWLRLAVRPLGIGTVLMVDLG